MKDHPTGAGASTFDLVDAGKLFQALGLRAGSTFLDLACGRGEYALEAADYVTAEGIIYALDLWDQGIETLRSEVRARGLEQIRPKVADISKRIPLEDHAANVCLIASALHDLLRDGDHDAVLQEVTRVLKPTGRLAVVEFKKMAGPPGPPMAVRLSPEEVEKLLRPHHLVLMRTMDIGQHHYLSLFQLEDNAESECGHNSQVRCRESSVTPGYRYSAEQRRA